MQLNISQFILCHRYRILCFLIITVYSFCNLYCTTRLSVTGDESRYYLYGINILKLQPQKDVINGVPFFNSHMPIIALNTLPRAVAQIKNPGLKHDQYQTLVDVMHGRIFSIICALILACYVLFWSTELYGKKGGILSLLLYVFSPDILAHSQLVGTDVYSFLFCTATFYHTWQYYKTAKIKQLLLVGLMLGLGQISKQSLLLLYPLVLIFLALRWYAIKTNWSQTLAGYFKELFFIGIISLLIINAGFVFYKTGTTLNQYHFYSSKFISYQKHFSIIGNIPLPFPEPYLKGFDNVSLNQDTPPGINNLSSYGATFFLGKRITGERILSYYTICCLYKLPITFLLLFFTSLLFYFKKIYRQNYNNDELFLLFPAAVLFISFCFLNNMYLGIRNIIFLLPLLFIFCGSILADLSVKNKKYTFWIVGILISYQIVSVARYFPHFLPYTNEFILNKKNAYKILGDNNLFYQEGAIFANEYLSKHPEIKYEPTQIVHGKVMVSLDSYLDFWHDGTVQWLINLKLEPIDHFHSGYLIFLVP